MRYDTRICGHKTKGSGEPCRRPSIKGGTCCTHHGGHSPLARQAAAETLAAAALPAARVLFEIIEDWRRETCPTCGLPKGDPGPVIRAAQIVLDRTGFHPALSVQVASSAIPPWAQYLTDAQLRQVGLWIEEAKERMESGGPRSLLVESLEAKREVAAATRDLEIAKRDADDAVLVDEPEQGLSPVGLDTPGEEETT
jgi:hypothetical protein